MSGLKEFSNNLKLSIKQKIAKIKEKLSRQIKKWYQKYAKEVDFLIIYNPKSGTLLSKDKAREIFKFLIKKKFRCLVVQTHPKKDYIPKRIKPHFILVVGGDGTLHKVVNEMIKKQIDAYLIPFSFGTGNDFATTQGMSSFNFKKFVEAYENAIKSKKFEQIPFKYSDVGKIEYWINDKLNVLYFINSAGINSFDAEVLKNLYNMYKRKAYSHSEYVLPLIQSIFTFKIKEYVVKYKKLKHGKKFKSKTTGFLVYNNSNHAGGTLNLPEAKIDDGFLNIIFFKPIPKWNFIKNGWLIFKQYIIERWNRELFSENGNFQEYFRNPISPRGDVVRDVFTELEVSPVYIFQCDGELYNVQADRMRISVIPKTIKIPIFYKSEE
ncbi:MAG: diacylglycerol kinase family protein [Candidatus Woesearchaeota archaeon]